MNDETEIDAIDTSADADAVYTEETNIEPAPKKRFGLFALLGTAFLSSVLGAAMIYGAHTYLAPDAPDFEPIKNNLETVSAKSDTLAAETKALKAQIARMERELKSRPPAAPQVDLKIIERRLAALEDIVPSLEAPQIDEEVLARLEALQSEGSQTLDLSEILSRLSALENETSGETDILERLAVLEARPQTIVTAPPTASITNTPRALSPFPEDKIRQAIDRASSQKGWLDRTLKKHISVQSEDNPRYLLEKVLKHLEAGEIEAALAAFDKLPPQVKSTGQNWRDMMESSE